MTKTTNTPVPISERLRDYLHAFSPVVGITPETITADQVPHWEKVAAMVPRVPALAREGVSRHMRRGSRAQRPLQWRSASDSEASRDFEARSGGAHEVALPVMPQRLRALCCDAADARGRRKGSRRPQVRRGRRFRVRPMCPLFAGENRHPWVTFRCRRARGAASQQRKTTGLRATRTTGGKTGGLARPLVAHGSNWTQVWGA